MKTGWMIWLLGLALAGCTSVPVTVEEDAPVTKPPPPVVLFPDYFLMEGFSLNDHGRIPDTDLIGADMAVAQDLAAVRNLISGQLSLHEWSTDKMEIGRQSFRVLASRAGAEIEIRAVHGSGPTQVFLLYRPSASRAEK